MHIAPMRARARARITQAMAAPNGLAQRKHQQASNRRNTDTDNPKRTLHANP